MPLQKQNIPIPLDGGLDTKTDSKLVKPGSMLEVDNGVYLKTSVITKRNGYKALGTAIVGSSNTIATSQGLAVFQSELLQFAVDSSTSNGNRLYSYSPALMGWRDRGAFVSTAVSKLAVERNSDTLTLPDMAILGNLSLYAWADTNSAASYQGVFCSLIDNVSGAVLMGNVLVSSTGYNPKCIACGSNLFVFYIRSGALYGKRVDMTVTPAIALETEFKISGAVTVGTNKLHDWAVIGTGNGSLMVWAFADNGGNVVINYLNQDKSIGTFGVNRLTEAIQASDILSVLALYVNVAQNIIWVGTFDSTGGTQLFSCGLNLVQIQAPTVLDSTTNPVTKQITMFDDPQAGTIYFYYEVSAAATYNHLINYLTFTGGVASGVATLIYGLGLVGKCFQLAQGLTKGGLFYLPCVADSPLQATYFLLDNHGNVAAKCLPLNAGGVRGSGLLPQVCALGNNKFQWVGSEKTALIASVDGSVYTQVGVAQIEVDFASASSYQTDQIGKNLLIGGGYLAMYDGFSLTELGFHLFPEGVTTSPQTNGGSMPDATYNFCATYEYMDGQGQVHVSAPSVAVAGAVSGGSGSGSVQVTIPNLRVTTKSNVVIGIYRTVASGTVFYRDGSLVNNPAANTQVFTSIQTDATLAVNQLLYTTGGIVENIAPPPTTYFGTYKDRIFAVSSIEPYTIWFSVQQLLPTDPISFNDAFTIQAPSQGGPIKGLKWMDSNVYIFKDSSIYLEAGSGPLNTGQNSDYVLPQLLASDVGCINPNSIVLGTLGILFQSSKGIYQISRTQIVTYMGWPVEQYNGLTITAATQCEIANEIRFLTKEGPTLVFNYFSLTMLTGVILQSAPMPHWSTFSNISGLDAVEWQGLYTHLRNNGTVWQETPGAYLDAGQAILMTLQTPWLHVADYARIYRASVAGQYYSPHILETRVAYDYQDNDRDVFQFNSANLDNGVFWGSAGSAGTWGVDDGSGADWGAPDGVYRWRLGFSRQTCQAIRLTFVDRMNAVQGQSYSLSLLTLQVGAKTGIMRPSQAQTVGNTG